MDRFLRRSPPITCCYVRAAHYMDKLDKLERCGPLAGTAGAVWTAFCDGALRFFSLTCCYYEGPRSWRAALRPWPLGRHAEIWCSSNALLAKLSVRAHHHRPVDVVRRRLLTTLPANAVVHHLPASLATEMSDPACVAVTLIVASRVCTLHRERTRSAPRLEPKRSSGP